MIGFRVDANEKIATGHLMRCIAIAAACQKKGKQCLFLLAEGKETPRLADRGLPYRVMGTEWNDMESEKEQLAQILDEQRFEYMVVDSYQATIPYLKWLNSRVPVLYIDDLAREIYPVTAVLHYSQWKDDQSYFNQYQNIPVKVLAGMEYTPLREEFAQRYYEKREKRILITTGGTDPFNITYKLLSICLCDEVFASYSYDVIVGSMNVYEAQLKEMEHQYPPIKIHKNITNMSDYMRGCEMAVSAGGTTLFELCACGIPTVCFSFAENQMKFSKEIGEHEIMFYAGDARYNDKIEIDICQCLHRFLENKKLEAEYARRMLELVDGKGCERIVEVLCSK